MIKNYYPILAILTIFLLGSISYLLQADAQDETKGVYVSKILTSHLQPEFASVWVLICADNVPISHPKIIVTSDVESRILILKGDVQENLCRGETLLLQASNLSSISAHSTNFQNPPFIGDFVSDLQKGVAPSSITKSVLNTPIWFSNPVNWYLDGKLSEKELTFAIDYLLKERIIFFI